MLSYKSEFIKKLSIISLTGLLIGMSISACKSTSETTEPESQTNSENNTTGETNSENNTTGETNPENKTTGETNPENQSANIEQGSESLNNLGSSENQTALNSGDSGALSNSPINSNGLNGAINNGADGAAAGSATPLEDPASEPVPPNTMVGNVTQDPFAPPGAPSTQEPSATDALPDPAQIASTPNVSVPEPHTNQSGNPPAATEGQESGAPTMAVNAEEPPEAPTVASKGESQSADEETEGMVAKNSPQLLIENQNNHSSHNQISGVVPEAGTTLAYYIQQGDSLGSIAQTIYGNKNQWKKLASENKLINPNKIYVGDVIYYKLNDAARSFAEHYEGMPKKSMIVKQGDTLSQIAKNVYGSEEYWRTLWKLNPSIKNPDRIRPGITIQYTALKAGVQVTLQEEGTVQVPARTVAQNYMDLP